MGIERVEHWDRKGEAWDREGDVCKRSCGVCGMNSCGSVVHAGVGSVLRVVLVVPDLQSSSHFGSIIYKVSKGVQARSLSDN